MYYFFSKINSLCLLFKGIVSWERVFFVFFYKVLWNDISAFLCVLIFCFKGTVSQDFLLQVFLWILFFQAPENKIRVISNFFKILLGDIRKSRYTTSKQHRWEICTGINNTGGKFAEEGGPQIKFHKSSNLQAYKIC